MTDKPKRKNDQPIPRRYWWFFGILALLLLIGLRFPVRLWASYEVNFVLYTLIGIACSLATIQFIKRFHWRHKVVIVMLSCVFLTGLNIRNMAGVDIPVYDSSCTTENFGMVSVHGCTQQVGCYLSTAHYVEIQGLPIVISTNVYFNAYCIFS